MANEKSKQLREQIAKKFIASLEESPANWKKEWVSAEAPRNGKTNRRYSGLNYLILCNEMQEKGFKDPRFFTFKQVQDMGHKLQTGCHGAKVEFWSFYDPKTKKTVTFKEAAELQKDGETVIPLARIYTVFNGSVVEGLEPYQPKIGNKDVKQEEVIRGISENLGVPIYHDGGDRAFYRPGTDSIHLPSPVAFKSQAAYNSTALHELGHSTGAPHRLNRDMGHFFGTEGYAKEELVAEITSCFAMSEFGFEVINDDDCFENHKAYIQSWISDIREKPEVLMNAIKQADNATDMLVKAYEMSLDVDLEAEQPHFSPVDFQTGIIKSKEENKTEFDIKEYSL